MTVHSSVMSFEDLRLACGRHLGWGRTTSIWTSDQEYDLKEIVNSGCKQVYYPPILPGENTAHSWSFLQPSHMISTGSTYSTGTVTVDSGLVTGNGTTFTRSMEGSDFSLESGTVTGTATVTNFASTTQLVIDNTELDADAGATYTLTYQRYALPTAFAGLIGNKFTYGSGDRGNSSDIALISEPKLRQLASSPSYTANGYPKVACITYQPAGTDDDTQAYVEFLPRPGIMSINMRYVMVPFDLDGSSYNYPEGSGAYSELYLASCIDIAQQRINDNFDRHEAFLERLKAMVSFDRRSTSVDTHGLGALSTGRNYSSYRAALREHRRLQP